VHAETRFAHTSRGEQPTGDLARLLEAEARFAELLAEAVRERERHVAEARAAAEAAQQGFLDGRKAEIAALDARIALDMRQRVERVEAEATKLIAAWSSLRPADLDALADRIAGRLLDPDAQPEITRPVRAGPERAR